MKKTLFLVLALLLVTPLVAAIEIPSSTDTEAFNEILAPVFKIYNFVKYTASVIAVMVLLFAGISAMTSGGNPAKRENAKTMAMYVVIGLIIIWAAPLVVNLIVS